MLALIILSWIFGSIAAYLSTGAVLTRKAMPRFWAKAELKWGDRHGYYGSERKDKIKSSVQEQAIAMMLAWPIALTVLFVNTVVDGSMAKYDPEEIKRRDEEQKARIEELEKELGIGEENQGPQTEYALLSRRAWGRLPADERKAYRRQWEAHPYMFLDDLGRTDTLMRNYDDEYANDTYTTVRPGRERRWLGDV